jgi:hypothetical protein
MRKRRKVTKLSNDRRVGRLRRIGVAAVLSLGVLAGSGYAAPPAEAAPPYRLAASLLNDLTGPAVRLPVKNITIAESNLQRIAQQARVPLARTTDLVTTSEVRTATSWQTVRTSIGALNTATEGPLRSASVEAACTVLQGQTVTVDGFLGYVAKAYRVKLTRGEAGQLVADTQELITNLRKAQGSPNQNDRVAVLLICYAAGAAL